MRAFDVSVEVSLKSHRVYRVRALDEIDARRMATIVAGREMENVHYDELIITPSYVRMPPGTEAE